MLPCRAEPAKAGHLRFFVLVKVVLNTFLQIFPRAPPLGGGGACTQQASCALSYLDRSSGTLTMRMMCVHTVHPYKLLQTAVEKLKLYFVRLNSSGDTRKPVHKLDLLVSFSWVIFRPPEGVLGLPLPPASLQSKSQYLLNLQVSHRRTDVSLNEVSILAPANRCLKS